MKKGSNGSSNVCFRKTPWLLHGECFGEPEALWGEQQEAPEKSRVTQMQNQWSISRVLWDNIKQSSMNVSGAQKGNERENGYEKHLKK